MTARSRLCHHGIWYLESGIWAARGDVMLTDEVVSELARRLAISPRRAREQLGIVTQALAERLETGCAFSIPGLGTFETRRRPETRGFVPFLRRVALLPPKDRVAFRPSKTLRELAKRFRW